MKSPFTRKKKAISYFTRRITKIPFTTKLCISIYSFPITVADPGGGSGGSGHPPPPIRPDAYNFETEILKSTGRISLFNWLIFLMKRAWQFSTELLPVASSSKRVLVPIFSYENEISFTCKLNSFSYEWLCTRPRFDREA